MRNLLNFLLKYDYWLLFVFLEVVSFILLFRFNSYQGSVFFTSANRIAGNIYEVASEITSYFGLHTVNRDLVRRNVELELQVESLSKALKAYTRDTTEVEKNYKDVLADYSIYPAQVVNNSLTHVDKKYQELFSRTSLQESQKESQYAIYYYIYKCKKKKKDYPNIL